jgi:hypothetical protein
MLKVYIFALLIRKISIYVVQNPIIGNTKGTLGKTECYYI